MFNRSVTLTATISPAAGGTSGTVTFLDGGAFLATASVATGIATYTTTALPVGSDAITAIYSGMSGSVGSTSAPFPQVVDPANLTWTGSASVYWNDANNWQGLSGNQSPG